MRIVLNRWNCTPLQDAVTAGDEQLARLLKSKGGTMDDSIGLRLLCDAATKGDVKTLNLLIKCAGLEVLLCRFLNYRSYLFMSFLIYFG